MEHNGASIASRVEPRLPPELERIIFEMAAHNYRDRVLMVLMQVAHRVRDWLQPLVYRVVVLEDSTFHRDSTSPLHYPPRFPSSSQSRFVRNLLISNFNSPVDAEPHWTDLLPHCHNLQELAMWCDMPPHTSSLSFLTSALHPSLRTVSPPGLLRLSASLVDLFPDGRTDFNHEIFKHLTHLEVLDFPSETGDQWVEGNNYACIPNLQYLSIAYINSELPVAMVVLSKCLEECATLKVLITLENDPDIIEQVNELSKATRRVVGKDGTVEDVPEDRVVQYNGPFAPRERWTGAWYRGALSGDDFWVHSEKVVQRRRRRRVVKAGLWGSMLGDETLGKWLIAMEGR